MYHFPGVFIVLWIESASPECMLPPHFAQPTSVLQYLPMNTKTDDLIAYFHTLEDDELVRKCAPGQLTESAYAVAIAELQSRQLPVPKPEETIDPLEEDVDNGDFISVARYLEPTEAHLLKSLLNSHGVPAYVANANLAQVQPFLCGPVGGTSLRVPTPFAERARDLIAEFKRGALLLKDEEASSADDPALKESDSQGLRTYGIYIRQGSPVPVVVKVGFSWGALFFGPLWYLFNRMWLNFAMMTCLYASGKLIFLNDRLNSTEDDGLGIAIASLYLGAWVLSAWFANLLLAGDLKTKGYKLAATIKARNTSYARAQFDTAQEPQAQ